MNKASLRIIGYVCVVTWVFLQPAISFSDTQPSCKMPIDVSDRIGVAQIFTYRITDPALIASYGLKRDYIWGDGFKTKVPGVHSTVYFMNDRDPVQARGIFGQNFNGTQCQSYAFKDPFYLSTHPSWVSYGANGAPANEFVYGSGANTWYNTPIDISNSEVREYIYTSGLTPAALSAKRFDGVAMDNVGADNVWGRYGVRVNGKLVRRYTGAAVDPAYVKDVADWMSWTTARSHANGVCSSANNYPTAPQNIDGYLAVAKALDISVNEMGFSRNCKPIFLDSTWTTYMAAFQSLAPTKGIVVIDQMCPTVDQFTSDSMSWSIANYLLIKGPHSYIAIVPATSGYGQYFDFPELHTPTGKPIEDMQTDGRSYWRHFENALAVVNPSSKSSTVFDLGDDRWKDFSGEIRTGRITLNPGSALVLRPVNLESSWIPTHASISGDPVQTAKLSESQDTANTEHEVSQYLDLDPAKTWDFTVEAKASSRPFLRVYMQNTQDESNDSIAMNCALSGTGSGTSSWTGSHGAVMEASSTALSDGWYRCSLKGQPSLSERGGKLYLSLGTAMPGSAAYKGDGSSGIQLRNASLTQVSRPWSLKSWGLANATLTPAGTNGLLYTESKDSAAATHQMYQYPNVNPARPWSLSVDVKANGEDALFIYMQNVSDEKNGSLQMTCGLTGTGTVTNVSTGSDGLLVSATSVSLGGGWYRCTLSGRPSTSGAGIYLGFQLVQAGKRGYVGDGQKGVYMKNITLQPMQQ